MRFATRLSNAMLSAYPQRRKAMGGKVLALTCEGIRPSVQAGPGVIKILKDFLDESRGEEAIAGAIVLMRPSGTICSAISAPHEGRHRLVAACDYLKQDIIAETDN